MELLVGFFTYQNQYDQEPPLSSMRFRVQLCAVCYACVVGMGLCFRAVLCSLCGSSVVGVARRGCGSSLGLFHGGVVG